MSSRRGLLRDVSRLQLLVAGLVVAGGLGLAAFAGSLVVAVMTAAGAIGGGTSLWVLLALLLTVLASGVAVAAAAAWLAYVVVGQLRTAVASTHRRVLYWAYERTRAFEDENVVGTVLRPSRAFASRSEREGPLVTELQRRYVAGDIDEPAFEAELERLLGEDATGSMRTHGEIEVTAADGVDDELDDEAVPDADAEAAARGERESEHA